MPVISVMLLEQSAVATHIYAGHISDVVSTAVLTHSRTPRLEIPMQISRSLFVGVTTTKIIISENL